MTSLTHQFQPDYKEIERQKLPEANNIMRETTL
jgi:hypothetical protein